MINYKLNKLNSVADDSLIFNVLNNFHLMNCIFVYLQSTHGLEKSPMFCRSHICITNETTIFIDVDIYS